MTHFIIHARKCLLKGLNPHQNRTIPPLRYEWIWALKRDFPHLQFTLNGGIITLPEVRAALDAGGVGGKGQGVAGVMVGRSAYHSPWLVLGNADVAVFGADCNAATSRRDVLKRYAQYADRMIGYFVNKEDGYQSPNVRTLTKPLLGMFYNAPKGKVWRAAVDEALKSATSVSEVLDRTLHVLFPDVLDAPPEALPPGPTTYEECTMMLPHFTQELPMISADEVDEALEEPEAVMTSV